MRKDPTNEERIETLEGSLIRMNFQVKRLESLASKPKYKKGDTLYLFHPYQLDKTILFEYVGCSMDEDQSRWRLIVLDKNKELVVMHNSQLTDSMPIYE